MKDISQNISEKLMKAALSYYTTAVNKKYNERDIEQIEFQAVLGNFSIAVELMLKAIIGKKCIQYLYANIPLEIQLKLSYPDLVNKLNRKEILDLENFNYNAPKLDSCISIFYLLYPEFKHEYKSYFKLFANIRNISVHGSFPSYRKYDLEKINYLAMKLLKLCMQMEFKNLRYFKFDNSDREFLTNYDNGRIERVKKKIEDAQNESQKIKHSNVSISISRWEEYVTSCPICGCDGILEGSTDLGIEEDIEGETMWLLFYADSFECFECNLKLDDTEELKLANIKTVYERDEDMDKYISEFHPEWI